MESDCGTRGPYLHVLLNFTSKVKPAGGVFFEKVVASGGFEDEDEHDPHEGCGFSLGV